MLLILLNNTICLRGFDKPSIGKTVLPWAYLIDPGTRLHDALQLTVLKKALFWTHTLWYYAIYQRYCKFCYVLYDAGTQCQTFESSWPYHCPDNSTCSCSSSIYRAQNCSSTLSRTGTCARRSITTWQCCTFSSTRWAWTYEREISYLSWDAIEMVWLED